MIDYSMPERGMQTRTENAMSEHVNPMPGQILLKNAEFESGYDLLENLNQTGELDEANAAHVLTRGSQQCVCRG